MATFSLLLLRDESLPYNPRMSTNPTPCHHSEEYAAAETEMASSQRRGCPHPTPEESQRNWAAWHQAMELSHAMLMMGLRQKIGPQGDLQAAYRDWYERYQAAKWDTNRAP